MTTSSLRPSPADVLWSADRLHVAGWSIDAVPAPGRLGKVATVRFQGCPWTCTSCETPELSDPMVPGAVAWSAVLDVLADARDELDAVVLTGGEPTRQDGLADAMEQIRDLGIPVELHTTGAYPQRLAAVVSLARRVVMEIKAPAVRYRAVTGVGSSAHKAFASLRTVLDAGVELQVRTVVDPAVLSDADVDDLRENLAAMGVRDHVVTRLGRHAVRAH
ncbi:MAG: radical SAM protein [Cellulomonadaceae bacterium]|nr:radical SAM protein [Cellulomonadaceae bacterium]